MANDEDDFKDPALKNFNRGAFQARYAVGETLKMALIGALIGAVLLATFAVAAPLLGLSAIPVVGGFLAGGSATAVLSGSVAVPAFIGTAAMTGALLGGSVGGALGLAKGMGGSSEAADDQEARLITKNQQEQLRRDRLTKIQQARTVQAAAFERQSAAMQGMNPNATLPNKGNEREILA